MTKRIVFLVGAGISVPAGFPKVCEITQRVLSGEGVVRTDRNYFLGSPNYSNSSVLNKFTIPDEFIYRVLSFLERLKTEIDLYYRYRCNRPTDYEDLYYVASQIRDSEYDEYDNPAVHPLIEKIQPQIAPLLIGKRGEIREEWELRELAKEATHYIRDIVWSMLSKNASTLEHLSCIKDACLDTRFSNIDIHTLNHDTLLEQCLVQNNIEVTDGFTPPQNRMRFWNPALFDKNPRKVRLFKLHGSLNWFRFRPQGGHWDNEYIGIPWEWDYWNIKDMHGQMQWPIDGRPMFLAGTFNKMLDYTERIYTDLHYQFYNSLRMTSTLVVCGYSFRDRGINNRIIDWFYSSPEHKVVVIHAEPKRLMEGARGSITNKWDKWLKGKKLVVINKWIENTSWQDIRKAI